MFSKTKLAIALALLLTLIFTIPVFAGGWAVITLDELPKNVAAGEEITVGFVVLQHGKEPMTGLTPSITANLNKDETFKVTAQEDKPGHYTATLTFPKEGEWNWTIEAFSMQQKMPMLNVSAPSVAVVSEPESVTESTTQISTSPNFVIAIAAFVIGLVSLFFAVQRKSKLAASITALCLMIGLALTVVGTNVTAVEAQSESSSSETIESSLSQVEYGRQLFIAKGCITCHYNSKAASPSEYWTIEPTGATNLSNFSADPIILEMRLKDPTSVNSNSQMPQLNLTKEEIDALIAFINSN